MWGCKMELLLTLGLLIVFALCPPIGAIIVFAILFSGGKVENLVTIIGALLVFVALAYVFT